MDKKFLDNINELLEAEGGYANDPDDPGGETKFGISKRSYPNLDIKNLTQEQAVEIYYNDWWIKYRYNNIDVSELAGEVLEASINMGTSKAHKLLQEAVLRSKGSHIIVDGILGEKSFNAINTHPYPGWLLAEYRLALIQYYLSLNKSKFLASWVRRAIT